MTRRHERGATLVIVAVLLPVLILMAAFAVDLGRQRASRRTMQARADVVALDMIRLADGRTEDQTTGADPSGGTTPAAYEAHIQQSADRNGVDRAKLAIEWGTWNGTAFVQTLGNAVPNAVEVVATESTKYFFRSGSGTVTRRAVATRDDLAHLSLGSTLLQANLGNSTLLNPILTGLLCGAASNPPPPIGTCPKQATITAAGWQGLATHKITLDALRAAGGYGTVNEMMTANLTATGFATIAGQAFRNNGDPTTAALYDTGGNSLATLSSGTGGTFRMADVLTAGSPADGAALTAEINPFNTFMSGLQVSNGSNFMDLSTAIPSLTLPAGISGLTLNSRYKVISTPVDGWGRVGSATTTNMRTAQVQLVHSLTFTLNVSAAGSGVVGQVTLPVDVTGGGATASLTKITCAPVAANNTMDVVTAPRPITGTVGTFWSVGTPATIGNVTLTVAGIPAGSVGLSAYGAIDPNLQTTSSSNLLGIALNETRSGPGSAFALGGAMTSVKLQTGLGVSALNVALASTLNALLSALDTASRPTMNAVGLSVSSSDVTNLDVDCQAVRLAS